MRTSFFSQLTLASFSSIPTGRDDLSNADSGESPTSSSRKLESSFVDEGRNGKPPTLTFCMLS